MKELNFNEENRPIYRPSEAIKQTPASSPKRTAKRKYRYSEIERRQEELRLERELSCDLF